MLFYNNHCIPNTDSATLFMVANALPFDNYQDHYAGISLRVLELMEIALDQGESPIALMEDYLQVYYMGDDRLQTMADFLMQQDQMLTVLQTLKSRWNSYDPNQEEDGLLYGSGISKEDATLRYSSVTFRSYLEVLSTFTDVAL